jgi:anaerobic selenocysteine-containing dehydrogenase
MQGLQREDLFTVVHELFMTDTADYADIVLPATSQLEHADLHKAYGHTMLAYNHPAIPPLGESKSNWEVMGLLAEALGFTEPWLHQSIDEVIEEILTASAHHNPAFQGITLEQLKAGHAVPLTLESLTPFADLHFPTPSGKVELFAQAMANAGLDPLPGWPEPEQVEWYDSEAVNSEWRGSEPTSPPRLLASPAPGWESPPLTLISGAAHHFVTSSMANQPSLLEREGTPFVEIHPSEAAARGIADGDTVVVENQRGWCKLRAVVTDAVRPGVLASPKGRWAKLDGGRNPSTGSGRNVNWTTPDALADLAGQSTFHSNRVWIRRDEEAMRRKEEVARG